jgi:hypothetical protein
VPTDDSDTAAEAFFVPRGADRYLATTHTGGPWDPRLQHAGPPSALLARLIEGTPGPWPAVVVRMSVDILGPVPVAELTARSTVLRSGRSVELVAAELEHDGRVAIRAHAWKVRRQELRLPPLPPAHDDPPGQEVPHFPETPTALREGWIGGYLQAMEWRVAGGDWNEPGPATTWGRMRFPLVPGEVPTGLQRVMAVADSGNGVSNVLPVDEWFFINPDLTVHLEAEPVGEWMCIDARTRVDPSGFGLASSRLFDRQRLVGCGAQSLYIGPR